MLRQNHRRRSEDSRKQTWPRVLTSSTLSRSTILFPGLDLDGTDVASAMGVGTTNIKDVECAQKHLCKLVTSHGVVHQALYWKGHISGRGISAACMRSCWPT